MSGLGRALRARFDQVCSSELHRLRRKTAALPPAVQAEIVAMSFAVAHAISAELEAVLDRPHADGLDQIVARLFAIAPGSPPPDATQLESPRPRASSEEQS